MNCKVRLLLLKESGSLFVMAIVMATRNRTCNFTLFQVYYNIAFL